jgi:hypothetical protein
MDFIARNLQAAICGLASIHQLWILPHMTPAQHIASVVGQRRLADKLGVGLTAVNNAVARGHFPATWARVVEGVCAEKGMECPDEAFNFRSPSAAPSSEGV